MPPPAAHDQLVQQALAMLSQGLAAQAVTLLQPAAAALNPRDPAAPSILGVLGMALDLRGRRDEALVHTQQAIAAADALGRPDAALYINLGAMLSAKAEHAQAIAALERARSLAPRAVEPLMGLANALRAAGRFADALSTLRPAMAPGPDGTPPRDPRLLMLAADLLWEIGRTDQAAPLLAAAVRFAPREPRLAVLAANLHNYLPTTPAESLAAHRRAISLLAPSSAAAAAPPKRDPVAPPLRVGLLSADLREHSCAYFLRPLLDHLDPARVALFAYFTLDKFDAFSSALAQRCAQRGMQFRHVAGLSPDALAATIRADQLDILIETDGLSPNHSQQALALRPAPRIITWLGYPNTTGNPAVDVRIVDAITDPPASPAAADDAHCERLVRFNRCFVCYNPDASAGTPLPPVAPLPARTNGVVTFGCFNTMFKFTRLTLATYASVLRAVPGSRLLLKNKACGDPGVACDLQARFKDAGIDPSRIICEGWCTRRDEHLAAYHRIDIALDSMPYCGTTTTCEALLMGVPVVTLRGSTHASRVGASLLRAVGLDAPPLNLVCDDASAFTARCTSLASDLDTLAALRASLRGTTLASPLCDGAAFAAAFTDALEHIARG
ncbi:MAG: tetratricopeptide repeat protein [Planctomycetota bacterium]|nr:tetratricopeptide repeat protein [Planctomycetota bacterium]